MNKEKIIINDLVSGNFILTIHAKNRLDEREISPQDLVNVGLTSKSIEYQEEQDTYKITGLSLEIELLHVVCAYEDQTLIITSYYV